MLLVIVLPFAIDLMFGRMVGRPWQAYAIGAVMATIPVAVLVLGSMSLVLEQGTRSILNPGSHGLTEITYAFASAVAERMSDKCRGTAVTGRRRLGRCRA